MTSALAAKSWDPSIKALTQFPDVLRQMNEKLDWTQKLGDAFLAQQSEVMDQIQVLRQKADAAGNLKTTLQQRVSRSSGSSGQDIIAIEPADPQFVYSPVYEPAVYGDWWYPDYPPYYLDVAGLVLHEWVVLGHGDRCRRRYLGMGPLQLAAARHRCECQQMERDQRQPVAHHLQSLAAQSGPSRRSAVSQ